MSPKFVAILLCAALLCSVDLSAQQIETTSQQRDYRDPRNAELLRNVDDYHFNQNVQMLIRGQSVDYPGPDLKFMLRYFPNHHGALNVMGKLWRRHRNSASPVPEGLAADKNADYYFTRAMHFAPDDGVVRMLYGTHLFLSGQNGLALREYEASLQLEPDSPDAHYNAGLFFVAVGNYERATTHAKFAYNAGYPLPGLRNKLMAKGHWDGVTEKDVGLESHESVVESHETVVD